MSNPPKDLPYSLEAEKAVLGSILNNSEALNLISGLVGSNFFFVDAHTKIYESILIVSGRGESPDIVTVAEELKSFQADNSTKLGIAYLVELTESAPVTENMEYYGNIIRKYYYLRRIISACQTTIQSAMSHEGSIEGYVEEIEKEFLSITDQYDTKGIIKADKVLESTIDQIQQRLESDGTVSGVPTGYTELDAITGGLGESDLIILAARPGMGKTALALNLATNAAFAGYKAAIFTLEMSQEQLMARVLSSESKVDSSKLRKGDLTEEEQDRLMEGARRIHACKDNLGIDQTPGITLVELRSRVRRFHKENGLDLVVIDYLQLMGSPKGQEKSREREISEISMGLKELAKELSIPVIALAQLNRGPDARPNKRPKISDLRESGSMEQDADMIFFVYRDEYYNPDSELAGIAEVIIGKNRHGEVGTVKLAYQPNYVCFQNLYTSESLED